ncbi:MAG: GTPase ObgE [Rhodothermaceae bacterium]|nr:GTPase ObgE [Rhodothermaceae bacterium]MYC05017.1 GTPase ObgE [Rhodothermaceae bacterium]MYI17898.1 GTPase ObgE [Rhodothermaceae bacterium]
MRFIDQVTVYVRSGHGGAGSVAFRREKYVPKGGPAGGNGGQGGSVILQGDKHLYTLLDLRYNPHQRAPRGEGGQGNNRAGKDGGDLVLRVPCGTIARVSDSGELLGEVVQHGDHLVLAKGGRGGKGNTFFKSATRQVPRYAQPGEPGEEKTIQLELKMLADVGLVGFPNAGKSTLVASVSAARPKIADYPFTTLAPSPGVVRVDEYESFVIADIPGIIEGASKGKGLGLRFLRHIERNAVLLFLIPVISDDIVSEFESLMRELHNYDPKLSQKRRFIALSKADLLPEEEHAYYLDQARRRFGSQENVFLISAVADFGLDTLKRELWKCVQEEQLQGES